MKALQIKKPLSAEIISIRDPEPAEGQVLLEVRKVGFCGSDLSTYLGRNPLIEYPIIPGHEIAATVLERGTGVPEHIVKGLSVTVVPYTSCGACSSCLRGRMNACENNQTLGVGRDGAVAEFLVVPWQKIVLGAGLSFSRLVLLEPMAVGFHAVDRGRVTDSDTVLVMGSGMIGMGALIRAKLRGALVIAADVDDDKLDVARSLGCDHGINVKARDLHEELTRITGGRGPDVIVEAVGNPETYRKAVEEVAFAGRVVCIGYAKDDAPLSTKLIVRKELDMFGSRNATALDFISVGKLLSASGSRFDSLISSEVPMNQAAEGLADWAKNPGKIIKLVAVIKE
jgi:threonine dehydrogenase-like Zn-dependent dehydrogenase